MDNKEAIEALKISIANSVRNEDNGDDAEWNYQTGVLITRNQAECLLKVVDHAIKVLDGQRETTTQTMIKCGFYTTILNCCKIPYTGGNYCPNCVAKIIRDEQK